MAKVYSGRAAEVVLFGCMIVNIVEILPDVGVPLLLSNIVLGIQAVTLDIAGFSLASMAEHARASGDEQAAHKAQWTGYFLIGLMIVTISLVTIGLLWPQVKPYTDMTEKVLILARVMMTVIYGHVIHSLRRVTASRQPSQSQIEELTANFNQRIQQLTTELASLRENMQQRLHESSTLMQSNLQVQMVNGFASLQKNLQTQITEELASAMQTHSDANANPNMQTMQTSEKPAAQQKQEKQKRAVLHALPRRGKPVETDLTARQFVFACLDADANLKLVEINEKAFASGLQISLSQISRYRKEWSNANANTAIIDANAAMQVGNE